MSDQRLNLTIQAHYLILQIFKIHWILFYYSHDSWSLMHAEVKHT